MSVLRQRVVQLSVLVSVLAGILTVLAILWTTGHMSRAAQTETKAKGDIAIYATDGDGQRVLAGIKQTTYFRYRNVSDKPVAIVDVRSVCSCNSVSSYETGVIAPGGEGTITVEYVPRVGAGSVDIFIITSTGRQVRAAQRYYGIPDTVLERSELHFGHISSGCVAEKTVAVLADANGRTANEWITVRSSSPEWLVATVESVGKDSKLATSARLTTESPVLWKPIGEVHVKVLGAAPRGRFQEIVAVELAGAHGRRVMGIKCFGEVE